MIRKALAIIALIVLVCVVKTHFFPPRNLVVPLGTSKAWQWEQSGTASGGLYKEGDAIRCEVLKTDGIDWHVQLYQRIPPLVNGAEYKLHFMAKADNAFNLKLSATSENPDIHPVGLSNQVTLDSNWKSYDYTFTAEKMTGPDVRMPYFWLGTQTGKVWIKDLTVEKA